jgi:singapore isolate B (sub-type 7) whole genome shotgun sequence assembly, scaffold_26
MNTSRLFVHDVTVIPPYSLLLFGGTIAIQHMEGTLSVDDWFKFTAPARVGVLVQRLRHYMDTLLEKKFEHPESLIADDPVLKGVCSLLISNGL